MKALPIFLDIAGKRCLVVGAGAAADAKAALLEKAQARVETLAPAAPDDLNDIDFAAYRLVYAAGGDGDIDRDVVARARAAGALVNRVDGPADSDFIMPAIVDRDPVLVGISTGGAAPVLARRIRSAIEAAIPAGVSRLARLMDRYRDTVRRKWPEMGARRRVWDAFLDSPAADAALAGSEAEARRAAIEFLNRAAGHGETVGKVSLVGAGPGAADLLTLRAQRVLQSADVIVHDRLIGPEILDFARRDATFVAVGKAKGAHSVPQDEINALLVEHARAGKHVARVKGGDPFVFGRGGEELDELAAHGVPVEIVPGVTAAAGCAASAGIPLTHRDHADGVIFVSGHAVDGKDAPDWSDLARPDRTLVIYMGVSTAGEIAERLEAHGLPAATPAAIIENGTLPDERVIVTTLGGLAHAVAGHGVESPALIVIGAVARFAERGTAVLSGEIERRAAAGGIR